MYYRKIFQAEGKICTYRVLEMKKTIACSGEYFLNQFNVWLNNNQIPILKLCVDIYSNILSEK